MKKTLILFALAGMAITAQAQTKKIWHKGHSGSSANFGKAISANLFETNESNFGEMPTDFKEKVFLRVVKILKVEKNMRPGDSSLVVYYSRSESGIKKTGGQDKFGMAKTQIPIHQSDKKMLASKESLGLFLLQQPEFMSGVHLNMDSTSFVNFDFITIPKKTNK